LSWSRKKLPSSSIEQVLAQLAVGDRALRIAVGGGDHPHVDLDRLVAADARHDAGFEHPQQLDLQLDRHLGDLVEEQRAAVGALEVALVPPLGAGEAAALVPEQLALDERRRDGAAVERQERRLAAPAQLLQRLRGEILAGAAFADQEHRGVGRRHPLDHLVEPEHRFGRAEQQAEPVERRAAVRGAVGRRRRRRCRRGAPAAGRRVAGTGDAAADADVGQNAFQAADVERFGQVVAGAETQRLHGAFDVGVAGHQHHFGGGAAFQILQQVDAAAVGQVEVDQRHVRGAMAHLRARVAQGAGGVGGEALSLDQLGESGKEIGIVIYRKGVGHRFLNWARTAGSLSQSSSLPAAAR
jgi:hypothetical protein